MKRKQKLQVEIEKLAYGGKGIARVNGRVVFVDGALPGDRAVVQIRRLKSQFAEAKLVELVEPSPLRREAPCRYFGYCGGCKWQNLDYQQQLEFKRQQVVESLEHIGGISPELVHATLPSPLQFGYRNKMEFSFTDRRWLTPEELQNSNIRKDFGLGFHVPGSFEWVMHIDECLLQDEVMNGILKFTGDYFRQADIPVFNLKTHQGVLRFLVLRKSFAYQQYMVNLVTFEPVADQVKKWVQELTRRFSGIVSILNSVNRRFAQIAVGEQEHLLFGQPILKEKLGGFEFEISANSFFQTNPLQAEQLYRTVEKFVGEGHELVWDLYSGTGTITMFLARSARQVIGFEVVESAVQDAIRNCEQNGVTNCTFVAGNVEKNLRQYPGSPDVVVTDPPRSGMHPETVRAILNAKPHKIVYVSCNPATMARDVAMLKQEYRVSEVQPVDMFPHTYHIESVVKLERR